MRAFSVRFGGASSGWARAPFFLLATALLAALGSGCATSGRSGVGEAPGAIPAGPAQDLVVSASQAVKSPALDRIAERRVVFMGEVHDNPDHHRGQLEAIRALHGRGVDLAIGLESFQRPFQSSLDDYVAGRIGESELLERTDYVQRWGFDFALYRDILKLARDRGIPLLALNAPSELTERVSAGGVQALPPEERRMLPTPPELAQGAYRQRLVSAFGGHGGSHGAATPERLARFLEVQMLWDETMARTAADYLAANPGKTLVILAGAAHVGYTDAIPRRLWRRYPTPQAWVFPDLGVRHPRGLGRPGAGTGHPGPGA